MALGAAQSVAMQGLSAIPVTIEAATGRGLPTTQLVGKADISVRESVQRLRAAFTHINIPWPRSRITLSLSPADVPKTGAHYDLAIAVAILNAQRISADNTLREAHTAFLGEVGLDGHIVPVTGVLPMVLALRQKGLNVFMCRPPTTRKQAWSPISMLRLLTIFKIFYSTHLGNNQFLHKPHQTINTVPRHQIL